MLIARFLTQQKWNLRLPNFFNAVLNQQRPQNNLIYKSYHLAHGSKSPTFINSSVSETTQKARSVSSSIRIAINSQDASKAKEIAYAALKHTFKTNSSSKTGRQSPSRLVAHSLVHALLRKGQVMDAAYEMKNIMSLGVAFHHRTLQRNISLLCSIPFTAATNQTVTSNNITDSVYPGDSESGFLLSALYSRLPPPTRLATSLLITGRRYRQKRTEEMFSKLIDACLLQGEIVIATLLFVLLVKDWQFRSVVRASGSRDEALVCDAETQQRLSGLGFPSSFFGKTIALHRLQVPYPEQAILQKILSSIKDRMVFTNTPTEAHLASIKSLALLAGLVEERSLPYGNISFLLRVIQDCPRGAIFHTITIRHRGRLQSLPVYKYLHNVLSDICGDLPSQKPKQADLVNPRMLPCLDLRSYNTLLHYSLRHRRSPAMANQILEHMVSHRKPPLKPDIVTYNILLRSASLLGRNDIASAVLKRLKEPSDSGTRSVGILKFVSLDKQPRRNIPKPIATQTLVIPSHDNTTSITPDTYTISSYIIHLVLTGQLNTVIVTLLDLFPILAFPPSRWDRDSPKFQLSLKRALSYGPYVLAAFLDGCQKAGKTGTMERLWLLAKEAEFDSWKQSLVPQAYAPWCLSIEAYTSLMKCYASESKKGLNAIRGHRNLSLASEHYYRELALMKWDRQIARGWGHWIMQLQGKELPNDILRHHMSKKLGWYLYNSMIDAAYKLVKALTEFKVQMENLPPERRAQLQHLEFPIPDARFFNALLGVFGRRPEMQYRRVFSGRSWWRRKLRTSLERFCRNEVGSPTYDNQLVEIARIMANYGYSLPIGFQRVLIGQPTPALKRIVRKRQVAPLAVPDCRITFKPFANPAIKTRGLFFSWRGRRNRKRRPKPPIR